MNERESSTPERMSDECVESDDRDRPPDEIAGRFRQREEEFRTLMRITEQINRGMMLEEILDFLYQEMRQVIPYNRIGLALVEQERGTVVSRWARSDRPTFLKPGYKGRLSGSTLERIINTGQPRIINDLQAYSDENPQSRPTGLILREGMRSSLTCPLIIQGQPVGFVFFTSVEKRTYCNVHVEFFEQIAGQLATIVEKGRLYDELAEQKAIVDEKNLVMTRELEMARHVQRALIPHEPPHLPGLEIAFEYEPVLQVGGDILDIILLGRSQALLFVADAMGHGVQAALVMSVAKAALHSAAQSDPRPGSVLASVNKVIARLFDDRFVTAACCYVDSSGPHAELGLAGHAAPLWFRAETKEVWQKGALGLPLGIAEDTEYQTVPIALRAGDALVFSTDGIVEARDPNGNQYGDERLKDQVLRHGASSAHEILAEVRLDLDAYCRGRAKDDDLTLLVAKCAGSTPGSHDSP